MIITLTPNRIIIRVRGIGIHFIRTVTIPYSGISNSIPIPSVDTIVRIIVAIVVATRVKVGSGVVTTGGLSPAWVIIGVGFGIAVGAAEEAGGGGGGVSLIFAPVGGLGARVAVGAAGGGVVGVVSEHVVEATCTAAG